MKKAVSGFSCRLFLQRRQEQNHFLCCYINQAKKAGRDPRKATLEHDLKRRKWVPSVC